MPSLDPNHKDLQNLRRQILLAATVAREGHIPSALSVLDILYCLYVKCPLTFGHDWTKKDTFILSKGHASLAYYAVLNKVGLIDESWVKSFTSFASEYGGHPDRKKIPGVVASTGSLGHGLPMGIGIALANRLGPNEGEVYVLIGDGELNEGSIWESFLLASHHQLSTLTVIVDNNGSSNRAVNLGDISLKLESFGFFTKVIDGHSHEELISSLERNSYNRPRAIIANTIKGFGVSAMENNPAWHHAYPSPDELNALLEALE